MIKIMSFNIRYGKADDGENRWDNRKELVLTRIQAFDPDLLGIQECRDDAQAEFVKENLPDYHFFGVRRAGTGETALEMAPVLYRKSRFALLSEGCFWLSETPQIPGSKSWDSTFPRTASYVELVDSTAGKSFIHLNTHFDYQPIAVEESARMLHQWVYEQTQPVIISGDFNADKNSSAYQRLTTDGKLSDAYRQIKPIGSDENTFHAYGQADPQTPIDWMLISNHFRVLDAAIDQTHTGSLYPSDHYPITAILDWQ